VLVNGICDIGEVACYDSDCVAGGMDFGLDSGRGA
jgi:hypothetical protein